MVNFFGDKWGMNSSCNSLSSEPLSLLESLYEREHGCTIDHDYQDFHDSSTLSLFHNNDAAVHYDHRLEFPVPTIFP
ncbi:unnamed protein product [Onchocerca flexuosa]|uniref:Ovule protein n=1 Tax=Onchocerca flexuosa TaxID=387005 RepID=A0A183HJR0_9BILA|nr:unnamed protein product [Onchocerca flexuosa]